MQIILREVTNEKKIGKVENKMTVFEEENPSNWSTIKLMPIPNWLDPTCSCGSKDQNNKLIDVDGDSQVCCATCIRKLFIGTKTLIKKDIPPDSERIIWHGRIEWSVKGDRWYSVNRNNIKPYANRQISQEELIIKANMIAKALHEGTTLRGRGHYLKEIKQLKINIDTF